MASDRRVNVAVIGAAVAVAVGAGALVLRLRPKPQQLDWKPSYESRGPGVCVDACTSFISWTELKKELETSVLPRVSDLPPGSQLVLTGFEGKPNWIVQIVDASGHGQVGNVWLGADPTKNWQFDGYIRIGSFRAPVLLWGTFQRYTDGSYRSR